MFVGIVFFNSNNQKVNIMKSLLIVAILAVGLCGEAFAQTKKPMTKSPTTATTKKNVVELVAASPDHTMLVSAIQAAGLTETLTGTGPFTIFAPTNAAFEKMSQTQMKKPNDMMYPDSMRTDNMRTERDRMMQDTSAMNRNNTNRNMDNMNRDRNMQDTSAMNRNNTTNRSMDTRTQNQNMQDTSSMSRTNTNSEDRGNWDRNQNQNMQDTAAINRNSTMRNNDNRNRDRMMQDTNSMSRTNTNTEDRGDWNRSTTSMQDTTPYRNNKSTMDNQTMNSNDMMLMQPENKKQLTDVLTYHVVRGTYDAAAIKQAIKTGNGKAQLTTVNGAKLTATAEGSSIYIQDASGNRARVITADMKGSNGVVHVVDGVVMPTKTSTPTRSK